MSRAVLRATSSSSLDWLSRALIALSSAVRAETMFSSWPRYSVRRFSALRRCWISVAMFLNCWLAALTSTPISSLACPEGHSSEVDSLLLGSRPLSSRMTRTRGLVSIT
ncbi:hypothetical protein D3C78_1531030 [compost metagenome]